MLCETGAKVSIVESAQRLLPSYDEELTWPIVKRLERLGVNVSTSTKAVSYDSDKATLHIAVGDEQSTINADKVLVTVGRRARLSGWGLSELSLTTRNGFLTIDEQCQTSMRGVYAIGDVSGEPMLAHRAMAQGEMVAKIVAGQPAAWDKQCIPAVCFTDPELVSAGLSVEQAKAAGEDFSVAKFPFAANGRAMTLQREDGFIRVVFRNGNNVILGFDEAIDPADLGDILYCHVPVVLFGQDDISAKAIDGIRAGAQCWLSSDRLTQYPLFDVLSQAKRDFCQQRDLVTSHAKYKAVVEDQTELICRFIPDTDFTLTFVNQAYANQLGRTAVDLEGQPLLRFILKRNQEAFLNKFCSLTPDIPDVTYDCRNLIDGDVYWTQWTDKAIYDSNGTVLEVQSVGVDVTARRSAEQRALDLESNFHTFFQEVPILMQELDPRGNIVNVNRCWCETMGYSADAVIDTHFYKYLLAASRKQVKSAYATLLSQR